jgi:hypothetical protein
VAAGLLRCTARCGCGGGAQEEQRQLVQQHPQLHQAAAAAEAAEAAAAAELGALGPVASGEAEAEEEQYTDRRWRRVELRGAGPRWRQLVQLVGAELERRPGAAGGCCCCCAALAAAVRLWGRGAHLPLVYRLQGSGKRGCG